MPDISKVQLPSGGVYDIKDATARDLISGGINFDIVWAQSDYQSTTAPTAAKLATIPAGVWVKYNNGMSTAAGTLAASANTKAIFKLVYSSTQTVEGVLDKYDEYVTITSGNTYSWEKIGDTQVDLSDVVRGLTVFGGTTLSPNSDGIVDINGDVNTLIRFYLDNAYGTTLGLQVSGNSVALKRYALSTGFGNPVSYYELFQFATLLGNQPVNIYQPVSAGVFRYFMYNVADATTYTVKLLCIEGGTRYEALLSPDPQSEYYSTAPQNAPLIGTFTATAISSTVTLDKHTDVVLGESTTFTNASSSVTFTGGSNDKVLGEATTFALSNGSVSHGTPTKDEVLGKDTQFNVTDPTISLGGTTKYLSASASGGGTSWNSKDQKTVVTGYTPTTGTFVPSATVEKNKKLVTTSVPNVTGNSSVSIPNVTGNTSVTIPNVTNVGSASTWSFSMGEGNDSETLIISGNNSTTPTLGTALTATNTTLGTALSASKVTLGTAITVATGSVTTSGTGSTVVTDVTVSEPVAAITALGDPAIANVIGSSSTFTNTQPTVSLTANGSSGTGRITYLESASPTASGGAVSAVVSGTGSDIVNAVTAMPTSTVGTGITVGTNDKVTAITSIGTGTAAAQTITVGTNDKVTVLTSATDVTSA